jgi:nucleotide-binding universal stress UspA family protein
VAAGATVDPEPGTIRRTAEETDVDATKQRIVVGIDGSAEARAALAWALTEAARRGADLEVVTAFPVDLYWADPSLLDPRWIDGIRADTETRARATVGAVREDPALAGLAGAVDVDVQLLVVAGAAAAHLVQRSEGAALLVVGSRGRGAVRSSVAGSVALHCSAHAHCPVVVVHPIAPQAGEPARVVVGLDDSEHARAALLTAVAQAGPLGARVDAVLAYEVPDYWDDLYAAMTPPLRETREHAQERGEGIVRDVLGAEPVVRGAVRVAAMEGHPAHVLLEEAEGAHLLVVGSRSRNELEGVVLGSVALRCVMHAPCPVMVVHQPPERFTGTPPESLAAAAPAG